MKELIVRLFFGVIFIGILLFTLFSTKPTYYILFFLLTYVCMHELLKITYNRSLLPYIIYPAVYYWFVWFKPGVEITSFILGIVVITNVLLGLRLFSNSDWYITKKIKLLITSVYLCGSSLFLALLAEVNEVFDPKIVFGIFVIIWSNDTFAYLVGKNFGKNKLLERVSPKKTIEGAIGGIVAAIIASVFLSYYITDYPMSTWIIIGCVGGILGIVGDLIQSQLKRQAFVKDSGKILPGHGGLYDRMDSIIYIAPFIFAYFFILNHVS